MIKKPSFEGSMSAACDAVLNVYSCAFHVESESRLLEKVENLNEILGIHIRFLREFLAAPGVREICDLLMPDPKIDFDVFRKDCESVLDLWDLIRAAKSQETLWQTFMTCSGVVVISAIISTGNKKTAAMLAKFED